MDFASIFASAAATPIVKAVAWPSAIAEGHPIRSTGLCVRFWPIAVASYITPRIQSKSKTWFDEIYWYVIASTICNSAGEPIFSSKWPEIWTKHVELPAFLSDLPPINQPVYDEQNNLVIPPPNYEIIGNWLKAQYDNPQGLTIMQPLWDQAMAYNGWGPSEGKNFEMTDT